jgi:hypothetical protein
MLAPKLAPNALIQAGIVRDGEDAGRSENLIKWDVSGQAAITQYDRNNISRPVT